ncbi:PREDICTED: histone-lysine N-methyltransferase ASHH2-like isoform X2 [Tarenaya hassleriana]|uniref:histone-lysine N-methyltransferase ASHH2-like isoform X2 n=1 Tax=Tarenaya hassleriana TaxID=28532 RepID=UPI00053C7A52|nr:PREDICTED: histone-lysine N-methyltransferase ASHH2-like isoform X2 [Tarenaya hassleriana]
MDCKEHGSIAPDGCSSDSGNKNADDLGSDHVMDSVGDDEMKIDSLCTVALEIENAGKKETRVSSNCESSVLDVPKAKASGQCSEKESSAGHDRTSVSPFEASQVTSGSDPNHPIMEARGRCFGEIKQMIDGKSLMSLTERHSECSDDDDRTSRSKDADNQGEELVPKELELTHRSIPDVVVPVDCNKQEDGKASQDTNYSVVPVVFESVQEKGDLKAKEDEISGSSVLPIGGSKTNSKLASVVDAPNHCEALDAVKDRNIVEIGGDSSSCTSDVRVEEERNELLSEQDAAPSDDASYLPSCQLCSDSILDIGGLSCSATENDLKASGEKGGKMDVSTCPLLILPQMFCGQAKEDDSNVINPCANDLEGNKDMKTYTSGLKLLHEADLHSNIPGKNDRRLENHVGLLPTRKAPDALEENNDSAADTAAEVFSQVLLVEENARGLGGGVPITMSSLKLNFPSEFEKGTIDVPISSNTVEYLRTVDDNDRLGGEITSASGTYCSETILSFPRRKGRDNNQGKKAQTKRSAPRSRKSSRKKQSEKNFESIFNCSKQKRSCFSKPARSCEWGLPRSTTQIFLQSNNLPSYEPPNQGPHSNRGNSKPSKSCRNGHREESIKKSQTSGGCCLRLKVKFGKSGGMNPLNVTVSKVIDDSLSNDNGQVGSGLGVPVSASREGMNLQTAEVGEHSEECAKLEKDDLEAQTLCGRLAGNAADDDLSLGVVVEECRKSTENCYIDAGTSPDSEVINSVPDAIVSSGHQGDLRHTVLCIPEACANPEDAINRKEDKKEDCSSYIGRPNKSKQPKGQRRGERKNSLPRDDELRVIEESTEPGSCKEAYPSFDLQLGGSHSSKDVLYSAKSKGKSKSKGVPKSSKNNGSKKGKSNISESSRSRRRIEAGERAEQQKLISSGSGKVEGGATEVGSVQSHETTDVTNGEMVLGGTIGENASADSAWVRCDDCFKWRRIPASLLGTIDENCIWICMYNLDKDFADCSIPQEMSDEEINTELGITQDEANAYDSDLANKEKGKGQKCEGLPGNRKACFKAIKTNQFLRRNRKALTIDEIMVCHCKPPPDGWLGCGEECLNRMLNIECVQGTCPCGDFCSNHQFQKRKYAKFERFQSGKKGYGLRLLEDVRRGQFLIEYVGEVLDILAYEARQKDYAAKGEKHFYFMTLNGNEVIDAGSKGNLGRFINHSCEPNCRTEKWMVNGEICVGIFSLRDIKKGEEVTFDYNYVRVFGAAAKKCYCGSSHCRGYIGGDPLNGDVVIQSDSDEEFAEPVMLVDDENGDGILDATSRISINSAEVQMPRNIAKIDGSKDLALEISHPESSVSVEPLERDIVPTLQLTEGSKEHTAGMSVTDVQQEVSVEGKSVTTSSTSVSLSKLFSDSTEADKMAMHVSGEDKTMVPRSRPLFKTSHSSGSSKRDKGSKRPSVTKVQIITAGKLHQQLVKSKGSEETSPSGHMETFEGKLNDLLDSEGGISKRKDSTKGYLKLLLLTAASRGNANNEGIQSNRDLSMILDALLKTKSRAVLMDVINKNGLQMLHNIMKQYRRDFKKTPILRKLLKVLGYLATREILTLEHIIRRPPCLGMESFKDSILTLTEHDDKQVHQIARNFRDRWIPKPFRRPYYMDRDERLESINNRFLASQSPQYDHQPSRSTEPAVSGFLSRAASSETASVSEFGSEPNSSGHEANGFRIRKRRSRWDQPAMAKEQRTETTLPQQSSEMNGNQDMQEDDLPPGFSSPLKQPYNNKNAPDDAVIAQPQGKFLSRLPVSYGIPLSIVHELGSPNKEDPDSWSIAPGIPFQPFPPLPPVSRDEYFSRKNGSVSTSGNQHGNPACSGENLTGTAIFNQACWNISGADTNSGNNRKRGFPSENGGRYFRQQKWNVPPWTRNGWGNQGDNVRGNTSSSSGHEPGE